MVVVYISCLVMQGVLMRFDTHVDIVNTTYRNAMLGFVEHITLDVLGVVQYVGAICGEYRKSYVNEKVDVDALLKQCAELCIVLTNVLITANNKLNVTVDVEAFEASACWREVRKSDHSQGWSFSGMFDVAHILKRLLLDYTNQTLSRNDVIEILRWVGRIIGHFGYSLDTLMDYYAIATGNPETTITTE